MIRKLIAIVAAAVALVAVPTAASAYTPVPPSGTTTTIPAGGSATFVFDFSGTGTVQYTLTGEGVGPGSLAATTSLEKAAGESVTVSIPEDGFGTYTLTGVLGSETVSVAIETGEEAPAAAGEELSETGASDNTALAVGAAGLLVVGAGAVIVAARRRTDA